MKPFQLSALASEEFTAAIPMVRDAALGVGGEFYDAVVRTIDQIRTHPEIGALRPGRLSHRRLRVARFPYTVVYRVRERDIYVVAVAHSSRRPGYWKNRA